MLKENPNTVETILKTGEESNNTSRLTGFQRLRECGLILGILSSIFFAIALLSFNPADPSWSQTAWGGTVNNAGGLLGAWIADTLFFTFGSLAYPIPVILTAITWISFRNRDKEDKIDFMIWGTRLLGLTLLILTGCGLADINFDDIWYFSSGGVVGDVLTSLAMPTLNVLGSTLVFLFLWGAGFTLLTGISWLTIVEWLGNGAIDGFTWVVNKIRGTNNETIKAQLNDPEPKLDQDEDAIAFSVPMDQVDIDDPLTTPTASTPQTQTPEKRQFNIHMPSAPQYAEPEHSVEQQAPVHREVVQQATQQDAAHQIEQYSDEERSRQLGATIDQLEQDAIAHNDFAQQESQADSHEMTQAQTQQRNEAVVHAQEEATSVVEISDVEEPLISMETLQQIALESDTAHHHIEPTTEQITAAVESTQHEFITQTGRIEFCGTSSTTSTTSTTNTDC